MVDQIGVEDGHFMMEDDSRVYLTETINFNHTNVSAHGKPTQVFRGIHSGFSLPIYAVDEELFGCKCLSLLLDDTEDIVLHVGGWLDTANNTKKFNIEASWDCVDVQNNEVVGAGSTDLETETTTGNWAQFKSFMLSFTLATVAAGCSNGYEVSIRIRRLAASGNEIAGEVVIMGAALQYIINKSGRPIV